MPTPKNLSHHHKPKNPPLEQARLADLNFSFQTIGSRSRQSVTPITRDKHKQVALEAFGFVSQKESPSKTGRSTEPNPEPAPASTPEPDIGPEPKKRKRRKVVVKSPTPSPSSSISSQKLPPSPLLDDREIEETQFAQLEPGAGDALGLLAAGKESCPEGVPPEFYINTPKPITIKPGPLQMLPPPTTPKRRKLLEIPSSHSPPETPISPYKSPSTFRATQQSPLSNRRSPFVTDHQSLMGSSPKWKSTGLVASSQWWDNEEVGLTQGLTQGPSSAQMSPELEDGSDIDDFWNQTFHPGRLFQSDRARGSFSPLEETQPATYKIQPQIIEEQNADSDYISSFDTLEKNNSQVTLVPASPQVKDKKLNRVLGHAKIKPCLRDEEEQEIFPCYTQKQYSGDNPDNEREFIIIPESPLDSPRKARREVHWGDDDSITTSSTPSPSLSRPKCSPKAPKETQYADGTQLKYEYWDDLPKALEDIPSSEENKHSQDSRSSAVAKGSIQVSCSRGDKKERERLDNEEKVPESDDIPTMSQLLPESLMESFPMPPPLTQLSSEVNWTVADMHDD